MNFFKRKILILVMMFFKCCYSSTLTDYPDSVCIEEPSEKRLTAVNLLNECPNFLKNNYFLTNGGKQDSFISGGLWLKKLQNVLLIPFNNIFAVYDLEKKQMVKIRDEKVQYNAEEINRYIVTANEVDSLVFIDPWWRCTYYHDIGLELGAVLLTFKKLGISSSYVLSGQHSLTLKSLISLKLNGIKFFDIEKRSYLVKELYISSDSFFGLPDEIYKVASSFIQSNSVIKKLAAPKKFFISRSDASCRRLVNEDDLYKKLQILGFERLLLGRLSIDQQFAFFSNAEIIVSPHGAQLTNIMSCCEGTKIVELFRNDLPASDCYLKMSQTFKFLHYIYSCDPAGDNGDYIINVDDFIKKLKEEVL